MTRAIQANSHPTRYRLLRQIATVAVLYILTGRIALLLAIPPGYATAVWPAAGVAIAAVLMHGPRVWPGIFIGSLTVNVWIGIEAGGLHDFAAIIAANGIAAGASLQAVVGARLVHRFAGPASGFVSASKITRFLLAAGPLACLVNATIGPLALLTLGIVNPSEFLFTWWNWWIGDTIGVVVVTPVLLIWSGNLGTQWQSQRVQITIPIVIAIGLVVTSFVTASQREQLRIETEFRSAAAAVATSLKHKLSAVTDAINSLRSFYDSSNYVSQAEFAVFAQGLIANHPELLALSWNPYITNQQRNVFETEATGITEVDKHGKIIPAAAADEYVVVQYIEPMDDNAAAIGFNVMSEPVRRAAITGALASGRATATGGVQLIQSQRTDPGLLVFEPVYRTARSNAGNMTSLPDGFVVGVILIDNLVNNAVSGLPLSHITIQLLDKSAKSESLTKWPAGVDQAATLSADSELSFAGRSWELQVGGGNDFIAAHRSASLWMILAGGMLLSGMLGAFLIVQTGHAFGEQQRLKELEQINRRLADNVRLRNRVEQQLSAEKARAKATLNSIADGVITIGPNNEVDYMNPVAETLTGWSLKEAGGKPVNTVFALHAGAEDDDAQDAIALCLARLQDDVNQSGLWLRARDGKQYAIRHSIRKLNVLDGAHSGYVIAFQDVTEERRVVSEIKHRATHDLLTGLVNRMEFERHLLQAITSAERDRATHTVCFLDLDHFKEVNDAAGHAAGDELLRGVCDQVRKRTRAHDTLARIGGDEFGLLLEHCPLERAGSIANDIVDVVNRFSLVRDGTVYRVGISIGLTTIRHTGDNAAKVIQRADEACYAAKKGGRNRVAVFDPAHEVDSAEPVRVSQV